MPQGLAVYAGFGASLPMTDSTPLLASQSEAKHENPENQTFTFKADAFIFQNDISWSYITSPLQSEQAALLGTDLIVRSKSSPLVNKTPIKSPVEFFD